jgi:hypothetical protein
MTDITLRPVATDTGFAAIVQVLKDLFSVTPLGIALAVIQARR